MKDYLISYALSAVGPEFTLEFRTAADPWSNDFFRAVKTAAPYPDHYVQIREIVIL